ncbi:MAG: serine/threonine protein kinase [Myxococcota bacterium]
MTLSPGDLIDGKYRILRLIGDGGMGSVYEARHEMLGVPVALKFLHADLAKRPGLSARFLQEARVSATIQSPHVAHVTDVDTAADGSPYLVMELLHGESLQALLSRRGKFTPDQSVDFSLQILAGLEVAHALGVVHRDMKPDNVFVTPSTGGPLLKLIDFGIAKLKESSEYKKELTRAGVVMGTPEYMAPEQFYAARDVDHRADIYSLGVMLFEMLSGVRPADGDTPEAIVSAVMSGNVRRLATLDPSLPPKLVAIVERALQPDRDRRFATAHELRLELASIAGELSAAGRGAATPAALGSSRRPHSEPAPALSAARDAVPDTLDGGDAPGVPRTLPPEEGGAVRRPTGTQAAAPPAATPAWAAAPTPLAPMPYAASPQLGRKRRRSALPWVAGGTLVLLLGAGIAWAAYTVTRPERLITQLPNIPLPPIDSAAPIDILPTGPTPQTVEPTQPSQPNIGPRTPSVTPPRTPGGGASSTNADAGTSGAGTLPLPFPTLALPSTLPPLPSTLPPLPTTLPTALPSFLPQIPGLTLPPTPAPTSSSGVR